MRKTAPNHTAKKPHENTAPNGRPENLQKKMQNTPANTAQKNFIKKQPLTGGQKIYKTNKNAQHSPKKHHITIQPRTGAQKKYKKY